MAIPGLPGGLNYLPGKPIYFPKKDTHVCKDKGTLPLPEMGSDTSRFSPFPLLGFG